MLLLKKLKRFANITPIALLVSALRKFHMEQGSQSAATLTFFTLFSLVPLLALMFGLARSFGFDGYLENALTELFQGHETIYENLRSFTETTLSQTKEGLIAGIGLMVVLWSVLKVLRVLDSMFNRFWDLKYVHGSILRINQFIAFIFLAPVAIVSISSIIQGGVIYLGELFGYDFSGYQRQSFQLATLVLFSLIFALCYLGLPKSRVNIKSAFISGVTTAFLFVIAQYAYMLFQGHLNEYGVIYGSFSVVPLFMLWIYFSWMIFIFGACLCYVIDSNITQVWQLSLEEIPIANQREACLRILETLVNEQEKTDSPLDIQKIATLTSLNKALVRRSIALLINANLVIRAKIGHQKRTSYLPSAKMNSLTDKQIISHIESATLLGKKVKSYSQ